MTLTSNPFNLIWNFLYSPYRIMQFPISFDFHQLQFGYLVVHFGHGLLLTANECKYPKILSFLGATQNLFMIILFADFYSKAYGKRSEPIGRNWIIFVAIIIIYKLKVTGGGNGKQTEWCAKCQRCDVQRTTICKHLFYSTERHDLSSCQLSSKSIRNSIVKPAKRPYGDAGWTLNTAEEENRTIVLRIKWDELQPNGKLII